MRDFFVLHSHSKNESFASRPAAVAAREDWLFEFRDRDQTVDLNDGIGKSKLMPLSTEVRFIKRCVNRLVIVGKFDENDEIGELFAYIQKQIRHNFGINSNSFVQILCFHIYLRLFFCWSPGRRKTPS